MVCIFFYYSVVFNCYFILVNSIQIIYPVKQQLENNKLRNNIKTMKKKRKGKHQQQSEGG